MFYTTLVSLSLLTIVLLIIPKVELAFFDASAHCLDGFALPHYIRFLIITHCSAKLCVICKLRNYITISVCNFGMHVLYFTFMSHFESFECMNTSGGQRAGRGKRGVRPIFLKPEIPALHII